MRGSGLRTPALLDSMIWSNRSMTAQIAAAFSSLPAMPAPLPDGTLLVMHPSAKPLDFNTSSAATIAGRMSPDRQAITDAPSSFCPNANASAANSASNSAALHSARSNFAHALSLGLRAFTLRTKSLGRPRFASMRLNASNGDVVMTPPKSKITVLNVMFFLRRPWCRTTRQ